MPSLTQLDTISSGPALIQLERPHCEHKDFWSQSQETRFPAGSRNSLEQAVEKNVKSNDVKMADGHRGLNLIKELHPSASRPILATITTTHPPSFIAYRN